MRAQPVRERHLTDLAGGGALNRYRNLGLVRVDIIAVHAEKYVGRHEGHAFVAIHIPVVLYQSEHAHCREGGRAASASVARDAEASARRATT